MMWGGGPTKNPKINKRGELFFGTGEYMLLEGLKEHLFLCIT